MASSTPKNGAGRNDAGPLSLWQRARRRFSSSPTQPSTDLGRQEAEAASAQKLDGCTVRRQAHLCGTVTMVTVNPRGSNRWLEAELSDGTGSVTLVWMGRRTVPGIEAGRRLRVQGMVAQTRGRKVIYNPRYDLLVS